MSDEHNAVGAGKLLIRLIIAGVVAYVAIMVLPGIVYGWFHMM